MISVVSETGWITKAVIHDYRVAHLPPKWVQFHRTEHVKGCGNKCISRHYDPLLVAALFEE